MFILILEFAVFIIVVCLADWRVDGSGFFSSKLLPRVSFGGSKKQIATEEPSPPIKRAEGNHLILGVAAPKRIKSSSGKSEKQKNKIKNWVLKPKNVGCLHRTRPHTAS